MKIRITIEDAKASHIHRLLSAIDTLQAFGKHGTGSGPKKRKAAVAAMTADEVRSLAFACELVAAAIRGPLADAECKSAKAE